MTIGIVIPTYNSKKHLIHALPPLINHPVKPRILVIDPESQDGTPQEAKKMGAEVLEIPYRTYNHGLTREFGRKYLGCDVVVMMTPDAYLTDSKSLDHLVQPILEKKVAATFGRQLPRENSPFFESFPRKFNYPEKSYIASLENPHNFFFSDSFAAYSNAALDEIGGFKEVLLGEDSLACAHLLRSGKKIGYVAEATVYHSHNYNLKQEFQRHFDTGLFRSQYRSLFGSDIQRGKLYAKELLSSLSLSNTPYGVLHLGAKWLGYKMGEKSSRFPIWLKRKCSSQKFYWYGM